MLSKRHEFNLSIKLGLRKDFALVRGMCRAFTDAEQDLIAEAIVEQVESSNWRVEQGPMPEGHAAILRTSDAKNK